jgi:metal-responsive CopG/Arc/MetJ family transcriptional regulator
MESNFNQKEEIERFSVSVPKDIYEAFEEMRKQVGVSRSQAIRNAMHLFIEKETQNPEHDVEEIGEKYTLGTIYLLMKHSDWGITHEHVHEEPHIFSENPAHSHASQTKQLYHDDSEEHQHKGEKSGHFHEAHHDKHEHEHKGEKSGHFHESHRDKHEYEHKESQEIDYQDNEFPTNNDGQTEIDNSESEVKMRYINVLEADVLKNMEIQHEFHDVIVSVTHIHAEHDICLETLIVKGKISRIKALYSKLRKLRSIIDIRLFIALSH